MKPTTLDRNGDDDYDECVKFSRKIRFVGCLGCLVCNSRFSLKFVRKSRIQRIYLTQQFFVVLNMLNSSDLILIFVEKGVIELQ